MRLVCLNCGTVNSVSPHDIEPGMPCTKCRKSIISGDAHNVSEDQLRSILKNHQTPVLVDFWAPWCKPCRSMASAVSAVAKKTTTSHLCIKLNTDEFPKTANKFRIKTLPTLVLFVRGKEVARLSGLQGQKQILKWLNKF